MKDNLISIRGDILEKLQNVFKDKAIESHVFGSIARGDTDAYSDIDIWFTFNDDEFDEIYKNRFHYYSLVGELLHICEPPQNAPIGGVHSALFIKTNSNVISVVDVYLCPHSTSFITKEAKKLFGINLPLAEIGFNPQKVTVDKNYRIDFFIGFIFGTIKKLARVESAPLDAVFREYENLYKNYNIAVEPLTVEEQNFNALEGIIENTMNIANEKQKEVLVEIRDFGRRVL
ncbi:MAG: nucleotidyltransferase domain-containing protein [Parcubacteria group bacterium]